MFSVYFVLSNSSSDVSLTGQGRTASWNIKQVITAPIIYTHVERTTGYMYVNLHALPWQAAGRGFHSRPAFSFSSTVWSPLEPPMHGGLLARLPLLLHCSGVLAWIASAWTQLPSSSFKTSFTRRWHLSSGRPSNRELTTRTRKWDSDPGGTECMWLSLWTSKHSGWNALVSLRRIASSTGLLQSCSMCRLKLARGRIKARPVEMGRTQQSIWCGGTKPPKKPEECGSNISFLMLNLLLKCYLWSHSTITSGSKIDHNKYILLTSLPFSVD